MNFDLVRPCKSCPFRLSEPERDGEQRKIWEGIAKADHVMPCHCTVERDATGVAVEHPAEQHCAGALLILEARAERNVAMQTAIESGAYEPARLRRDAFVELRGGL